MIKPGVSLEKLTPQMAVAYTIASFIFQEKAGVPCVITSGDDSKHGPNSLHYEGKALDLRTKHLPPGLVHPVFMALQNALGDEFDVVLEDNHLHLEYDPK
jgi:hypothetical protein